MFFHHHHGGRGCHPGRQAMPGGWGHRGWHGRGFGGGREGRDGGGRSRRMFDGGELRLVLLKLIADEPRHGYDLIRQIEELTGGAYAPSPGVVYPTITMLDDMGFIAQQHEAQLAAVEHATRAAFAALAASTATAPVMAVMTPAAAHAVAHPRVAATTAFFKIYEHSWKSFL